jgi:hypothetical protein
MIAVQDSKFRSMNNTPELVRRAGSITSLAASIADLIQTQIKAAACNEATKQVDHPSEVALERSKSTADFERRLLCDIGQAAEMLSVSPISIRRLIQRNRLSRIPSFRKILISYDELRKFAATAS